MSQCNRADNRRFRLLQYAKQWVSATVESLRVRACGLRLPVFRKRIGSSCSVLLSAASLHAMGLCSLLLQLDAMFTYIGLPFRVCFTDGFTGWIASGSLGSLLIELSMNRRVHVQL